MTITRENMVDLLSEKSGYWKKDVRELLHCLDAVVFDELCKVNDEEDILIQLVQGVKLHCTIIPERQRKDPRNQNDITCPSTCRIKAKFSQDFKVKLSEAYENNKNG